MPRIIDFRGRRISVPDDATDEEVAQIIEAPPAASPVPAASAQPEGPPQVASSLLDTIMSGAGTAGNIVDRGVRGVAKGLVNIATLPVEAAAMVGSGVEAIAGPTVANLLPTSGLARLQPYIGAQAVKGALDTANEKTADLFGVTAPQREGSGIIEKGVERVGEEVGAAMVPIGAAINKGRQGAEYARKLPLLARMFVEPAAINPAKFATKEVGTAAMAGAGASALTQFAGTEEGTWQNAVADVIGALTGAGALGAARTISKPVGDIAQAVFNRDKFNNRVVSEAATDQIANASSTVRKTPDEPVDTQPLVDAIMNGRRVDEAIPGFRGSTADRTADPGLAALEYGRQSGPNSGLYTQRRGDNTGAIDNAIGALEPQGTPGALRSELDAERGRRQTDASVLARNAADDAENLTSAVQPTSTPQARGSTIRTAVDDALARFVAEAEAEQRLAASQSAEASRQLAPVSDPAVRGNVVRSTLEQERAAARERTAGAYDAANVSGKMVDPAPLTEALESTTRGMTETERALVPQSLIDRVARLGRPVVDETAEEGAEAATRPADPVRLKEATDLKSELDRRRRAALADPNAEHGGRNAARVLQQQIDAVDEFIARNLTDEEQEALAAARGTKFEEAEGFTRKGDVVAGVLARQEGGRPRVRDERVAGQFVNPATEEPLTQLFAQADTPQVRAAISDEILSAVPRGANAAQLERFVQDYEIPLRQFPGLREQITSAAGAQRGAEAAESAVTARRGEFAGDSRALADTTARRSDGQPALLDEQVPGRFVNQTGNRDLDALLSRADTPEVRKAIEDEIVSRGTSAMSDADRLRGFVDSYAEPLARFPGLREKLLKAADARGTARQAADAEASLTRTLGTPDRPGTSTVGQYLRYGDERAQDALKGVLAAKDPAKAADELLSFVNDSPEAVEGGRKAFWDLMQTRARSAGETTKTLDGAQPWMPRRLKAFLDDPATRAVAERFYRDNPEHLANIDRIADALQNVDIRSRAKAVNSSGTPQGVNNVLTPETVQSRFYAYKRGQTSFGFMITALASVAARRAVRGAQADAIEKLIDRALLDPDMAATLLKENNPANRAAVARTAKAFLGNQASGIMEAINDDEEDPVKGAVMRDKK